MVFDDLSDDAFDELQQTVSFWRDYAGQIRADLGLTEEYTDYPTPSNIIAYLMQDVGAGESALAAQLIRVSKRNQFKMDMYGVLPVGTPFPFRLKLYGVISLNGVITRTELFTTDIIANKVPVSATDTEVKAAILATGVIKDFELGVAFGTPFSNPLLVPNSFQARPDGALFTYNDYVPTTIYDPAKSVLSSPLNTWLFAFNKLEWEGTYGYLELTPFTADGNTKFADYNNLLVCRPVYEAWTGIYVKVTDMFHMAGPTPLKGGSRVICINFDDIGYGIVSAYQRDFDVSPTGA